MDIKTSPFLAVGMALSLVACTNSTDTLPDETGEGGAYESSSLTLPTEVASEDLEKVQTLVVPWSANPQVRAIEERWYAALLDPEVYTIVLTYDEVQLLDDHGYQLMELLKNQVDARRAPRAGANDNLPAANLPEDLPYDSVDVSSGFRCSQFAQCTRTYYYCGSLWSLCPTYSGTTSDGCSSGGSCCTGDQYCVGSATGPAYCTVGLEWPPTGCVMSGNTTFSCSAKNNVDKQCP